MTRLGENFTNVIQGDFLISENPDEILTTVLGSCVAVCLFDPRRKVGGMNHFLLPKSCSGQDSNSVRYGANAMELLINGLLKKGAQRENLQAKVFGGANMTGAARNIGASNAKFARTFLDDESIVVISESLGGNSARRIKFWPTTGQVKQLLVEAEPITTPEPALPPRSIPSEITLF
jgi:chemotaxis protein CheD